MHSNQYQNLYSWLMNLTDFSHAILDDMSKHDRHSELLASYTYSIFRTGVQIATTVLVPQRDVVITEDDEKTHLLKALEADEVPHLKIPEQHGNFPVDKLLVSRNFSYVQDFLAARRNNDTLSIRRLLNYPKCDSPQIHGMREVSIVYPGALYVHLPHARDCAETIKQIKDNMVLLQTEVPEYHGKILQIYRKFGTNFFNELENRALAEITI